MIEKKITPLLQTIVISLCVFFSGVSHSEVSSTSETLLPATIIKFSETELGSPETPVVITVTDKFMRIDDSIVADGSEEQGFILYNRNDKVIYSVSSEEQQVIKIKNKPVNVPSPIELKLQTKQLPEDKNAPLIEGKKTQNYQLFVNDKLCFNVISVAELMPDVVMAMGEFNQVLASQQADTLRFIPGDLHEACDLARHTFYPKNHLKTGFPLLIQAMDETGIIENVKYSRILVNFKQKKVSSELFVLPVNYSIVPIH